MESIADAPPFPLPYDTQSIKQLSNEELCREADGLYAGVIYLNQTEQIEDTVVDVDDDDDENEEEELAECSMVPESGKKKTEFEVIGACSQAQSLDELGCYPRTPLCESKCLSFCWNDDDRCNQSQQKKTSNCPEYLLYHWIEVHGETTVMSNDRQSLIWLCPVPSCTSSFTSKPDLLRHILNCDQIDNLDDLYWCNAHNKLEYAMFDSSSSSSRHQESLGAPSPTDFKVLVYKLNGNWPLLELRLDPESCPRCKHSNDLDFFTPEEVIDHLLDHQIYSLPVPYTSIPRCWGSAARSIIRDFGLCDPTVAGILAQAEARIARHHISKFRQFLRFLEIRDDGVYCGRCKQLTSEAPFPSRRLTPLGLVSGHHSDDIKNAIQHLSAHGADDHIPTEQRRHILASAYIHISFQHLKYRQELLHTVQRLELKVYDSWLSCENLFGTAALTSELPDRVSLWRVLALRIASIKSQLPVHSTTPLPEGLPGELRRFEKITGEYFAVLDSMDLSRPSEEIQLSSPIMEEKKKLIALLERMSSLNKRAQMSSRDKQWANLRSLRFSSSLFHSQILSLTGRKGRKKFGCGQRKVIRRLRQQIESSSDFLATGILTFRSILQGSAPSTLKEVLAFVSLSHVMSEELLSGVNMTKPLDLSAGFPHWMRAIWNQAEQAAFQELAAWLWPESAFAFVLEGKLAKKPEFPWPDIPNNINELSGTDLFSRSDLSDTENMAEVLEFSQSSTALEGPYGDTIMFDIPIWNHVLLETQYSLPFANCMNTMMGTTMHALPYFEEPVQELLGQSNASCDFHYSDVFDARPGEEWPGQSLDLTPSTLIPTINSGAEIVEIEAEAAAEVAPSGINTVQSSFIGESLSSSLEPEELVGEETIERVEAAIDIVPGSVVVAVLWATAIFQIVLSYMNYVCGLGDLLTYFAGNANMRRRKGWVTSASPLLKENALPILAKVLHPLLIHHDLGELKHVVGVTSAVLQQGFFACLCEVEDYLVHLARLFAQSKSSYMALISKSLKYIGSALLVSFSSTYSCACGTYHGFSTRKENRAREAEQARWVSERFDDYHDLNAVDEPVSPTWDPAIVLEELPCSSNTTSPFNFTQTWGSHSSNSSGEAPISALSVNSTPLSEAAGPAIASDLYCDTCSVAGVVKSFSGPDARCNLRRHMREKHEGKQFTCPSCNAPCSRLGNLRTHWMRKHKEDKMPAWLETRSSGRHASHRVSPY